MKTIVAIVLALAASAQAQEMTITHAGSRVSYKGPEQCRC